MFPASSLWALGNLRFNPPLEDRNNQQSLKNPIIIRLSQEPVPQVFRVLIIYGHWIPYVGTLLLSDLNRTASVDLALQLRRSAARLRCSPGVVRGVSRARRCFEVLGRTGRPELFFEAAVGWCGGAEWVQKRHEETLPDPGVCWSSQPTTLLRSPSKKQVWMDPAIVGEGTQSVQRSRGHPLDLPTEVSSDLIIRTRKTWGTGS